MALCVCVFFFLFAEKLRLTKLSEKLELRECKIKCNFASLQKKIGRRNACRFVQCNLGTRDKIK